MEMKQEGDGSLEEFTGDTGKLPDKGDTLRVPSGVTRRSALGTGFSIFTTGASVLLAGISISTANKLRNNQKALTIVDELTSAANTLKRSTDWFLMQKIPLEPYSNQDINLPKERVDMKRLYDARAGRYLDIDVSHARFSLETATDIVRACEEMANDYGNIGKKLFNDSKIFSDGKIAKELVLDNEDSKKLLREAIGEEAFNIVVDSEGYRSYVKALEKFFAVTCIMCRDVDTYVGNKSTEARTIKAEEVDVEFGAISTRIERVIDTMRNNHDYDKVWVKVVSPFFY